LTACGRAFRLFDISRSDGGGGGGLRREEGAKEQFGPLMNAAKNHCFSIGVD
jgi:hypothetical protein